MGIRRSTGALLAGLAVAWITVAVGGAAEQRGRGARDDTDEMRRLLAIAQAQYLQERWLEAAGVYEQAYRLRPHRSILWNIALCTLRGGDPLESQLAFEQYLAGAPRAVRTDAGVRAALDALDADPHAPPDRARSLLGGLAAAIDSAERAHRD